MNLFRQTSSYHNLQVDSQNFSIFDSIKIDKCHLNVGLGWSSEKISRMKKRSNSQLIEHARMPILYGSWSELKWRKIENVCESTLKMAATRTVTLCAADFEFFRFKYFIIWNSFSLENHRFSLNEANGK